MDNRKRLLNTHVFPEKRKYNEIFERQKPFL